MVCIYRGIKAIIEKLRCYITILVVTFFRFAFLGDESLEVFTEFNFHFFFANILFKIRVRLWFLSQLTALFRDMCNII